MSCKDPSGAGDRPDSPQAEDDRDQAAVLTHVLALHPTHLSVPDLVREVSAGAAEFDGGDRIERAVLDLVAVGLLYRSGGLVVPTHAAIRFDRLLGE